jgi:uncharacterized membrane protein
MPLLITINQKIHIQYSINQKRAYVNSRQRQSPGYQMQMRNAQRIPSQDKKKREPNINKKRETKERKNKSKF